MKTRFYEDPGEKLFCLSLEDESLGPEEVFFKVSRILEDEGAKFSNRGILPVLALETSTDFEFHGALFNLYFGPFGVIVSTGYQFKNQLLEVQKILG